MLKKAGCVTVTHIEIDRPGAKRDPEKETETEDGHSQVE